MENHFDLSDREFESQFAKSMFDPKLFSHEAHLRLAWIHVTKYGEPIAIQNVSDQLKQFVTIVGARDKYNHTLTVAAQLKYRPGVSNPARLILRTSSGRMSSVHRPPPCLPLPKPPTLCVPKRFTEIIRQVDQFSPRYFAVDGPLSCAIAGFSLVSTVRTSWAAR